MMRRNRKHLTVLVLAGLLSLVWLFQLTNKSRFLQKAFVTEIREYAITKPICLPNKTLSTTEDLLCMEMPSFLPDYKNPCWRNGDGRLRCLPYFMQIGMSKSGSTDLFDRITQHPDILGNQGVVGKETRWWSWIRYGTTLIRKAKKKTFEDYLNLFNKPALVIDSPTKTDENGFHFAITGDGSPMDAWDFRGWTQIPQNKGLKEPQVLTPDLVRHVNKNTKFIMIMRNPVERLYSDYYFMRLAGDSSLHFHNSVVASIAILNQCLRNNSMLTCLTGNEQHQLWNRAARIHIGFYSEHVKQWLRVFPRKQILFLRTEDYSADVSSHMSQIFNFLGSRPLTATEMKSYGISLEAKKHVTARKKAKGPMLQKTRELLTALYEPYNKKLAEILHEDRFLWRD
ncbi:carbohydrate sulfotransferase 15-like [Pecten maximus]|uniref:carbohydrate sulfotransferase 15-like n=1 Tax=Pecten maximus TaxID=6579 RepID=UPI001457E75B|nr:carbohydrate sulfotransferase 15-like [Pecten maximus]